MKIKIEEQMSIPSYNVSSVQCGYRAYVAFILRLSLCKQLLAIIWSKLRHERGSLGYRLVVAETGESQARGDHLYVPCLVRDLVLTK